FHGNVAGPDHGRARGQGGQGEEAVGVDAVLGAGYVGAHGTPARGDQDMVGGVTLAVDFDGVRIDEVGPAPDDVDLVLAQHGIVRGVDAVNVGAAILDQPVPVEAVQRGVEAVVGPVVMNGFGDLRRVPHDFLGHAAHIDAGAAKLFGLDQRASLSVHGGAVGGRDAAA